MAISEKRQLGEGPTSRDIVYDTQSTFENRQRGALVRTCVCIT